MTRSELEDHMQTSDNLLRTGSSFNVTGEVVFAPTYRLAATIFRQHNLSTPVLEKAVIIRIASNALCLYNWLHPSFESNSNMKSQSKSDSSLSSFTSMELSNCCTTPNTSVRTGFTSVSTLTKPILSVHSKSLMAIIVDATENIIVYSPPAYTELIGLSWVTAIGLKLNELVARQTSVGFPSELRSHQYHHHSYNLPDNENVLVAENSVNTNYKQRSSSNRYEFECTGIDQTVSSTHPFKSSQNQQQQVNPVEKRVLSEMIWPSSTSTSDRPVFLSSILPTTTIPTSHTGYLDHLNNETEVGVTRNVEDSTAAVTATGMPSGKCKTDQV
ncbi:unnamed protein product [Heterobilharzia americana]|nr:unnamed protein product [Heterobilharzia americana]